MKITRIISFVLVMVLTACSDKGTSHKEMPIVAHIEDVNGEPLTVCRYDLLTDTVDIPLSDLVEELQFVKLDNREEALVGMAPLYISDNYILVGKGNQVPFKLFRRDGKFINKVGSIGQGPGEYQNIYDVQIDEKHGRIYLLPWITNRILVYNMEGKYETYIPLNMKQENLMVPKGIFRVDADRNRVEVVLLPFNHLPVVAWVQDMEGNIIGEIPSGHLKIRPDFSNEVSSSKVTDALDFHLSTFFEVRQDTLYHLDNEQVKLLPRFTMDFGTADVKLHSFYELPMHYYGFVADMKQTNDYIFDYDQQRYFIVDKTSGRGNYCRIYNDYLGDEQVTWIVGQNGYYTRMVEPSVLAEEIDKTLREHPSLDAERRKKLETFRASIDEDDNNYVFFGKQKRKE
ncbi:MAG: 6-bladed beta-propeller [Bacteroides sp.]|nr:6-bladed beta-propeller [Bacteroides sp.]MBQ8443714.1 6-bladed beta-propeller [Bacteroides sp.]